MLDFTRIVGFDWDAGNSLKSLDKHNVEQSEAQEVFLDPNLLVMADETHSQREQRYHAYGEASTKRRLQVSFTLRRSGTVIRVISARDMSRRERARYEKET